ncbi:MAG: endonuclease/exonuclease/phosphatase family protein [Paludibacter sp.]
MKKLTELMLIGFLSVMAVSAQLNEKKLSFLIATYNIRLETPADSGARAWEKRKFDVKRIVQDYKFDIFGVQEVGSSKQEADLKALIPEFSYFGKGRDSQDGTKGEQIGVFYKTNRFSVKVKGSFFLSETPELMSKGWDADFRRMCVWTKLYDRDLNKDFFLFCTHFDHIGKIARIESAKLIISRIKAIAGEYPILLVGDLNSSPQDTAMYQALTDYLTDTAISANKKTIPTDGTFNGYDMKTANFPANKKIDYIFYRKMKALDYRVLNTRYNELSYPSDHFPVMCDVSF